MQETQFWSLGQEDPLEKEMAAHSNILALEIPWTEELGGLQSYKASDMTDQLTLSLFSETDPISPQAFCWFFISLSSPPQ